MESRGDGWQPPGAEAWVTKPAANTVSQVDWTAAVGQPEPTRPQGLTPGAGWPRPPAQLPLGERSLVILLRNGHPGLPEGAPALLPSGRWAQGLGQQFPGPDLPSSRCQDRWLQGTPILLDVPPGTSFSRWRSRSAGSPGVGCAGGAGGPGEWPGVQVRAPGWAGQPGIGAAGCGLQAQGQYTEGQQPATDWWPAVLGAATWGQG